MPLLDHFAKPWDVQAPWESVGTLWIANVVRSLNRSLPKEGFRALAQVHLGHMVEADVAEFARDPQPDEPVGSNGGLQTAVIPEPILTFDPTFPDEFEVKIKTIRDEMKLVAVIEFISPSNKDRDEAREKFVNKCVGYLQLGIGVVLVDTITYRHANLHNELLTEFLGKRAPQMTDSPTYVSAFRPNGYDVVESINVWPYPLVVGQPIPSVPLPIKNGLELMIDLETTYMQSLADHNL